MSSNETDFYLYIPRNYDGRSGVGVTKTLMELKDVSIENAKVALHDALFEKINYFKCDPEKFDKDVAVLFTKLKVCDFDNEHVDIPCLEQFEEIEFYEKMLTRSGFCEFFKNIASFYASNMIYSLCKKCSEDKDEIEQIHRLYKFFENVFRFTYHEKTIEKMDSLMTGKYEYEYEYDEDDEDLFYAIDILNLYKKFEFTPSMKIMLQQVKDFETENYEDEEAVADEEKCE